MVVCPSWAPGDIAFPRLRSLLEQNSILQQRLSSVEGLPLQRVASSLMAPGPELGFMMLTSL